MMFVVLSTHYTVDSLISISKKNSQPDSQPEVGFTLSALDASLRDS